MNSWKVKFAIMFVIVGLLAACAAPATEPPTSQPTEPAATATQPATEVVTEAPTEVATEAATMEAPATEAAAGTVSFASDILPMFESRCINCHGGQRTEEELTLTSHAGLLAGSEDGAVIVPGDGANSLLVQLVAEGKMPKRGPKLTPDQVQLITTWINEGALDN